MNNFSVRGGWRLSAAKPQNATNWGTAALCPSHPSSKSGSYSSAAPHRIRPPAAFTLVEVLLSVSIAAIAGSVLLLGITSSTQTTIEALQQTIALGMAQQLMDEAVGEIGSLNVILSKGPVAVGPYGVELDKDQSEKDDDDKWHSVFPPPDRFFEDWWQVVDVEYDESVELVTVKVEIYRGHPDRDGRRLAELRQVTAYAP